MKLKWPISRDWLIPLFYLLFGLMWILTSDTLLFKLAESPISASDEIEFLAKIKGYFFVAVTALLLFFLIRARTKSLVAVKNDFFRLFEENPNPMRIYELETNRVVQANSAACELYGYSHSEFTEKSIKELWLPGAAEKFEALRAHVGDGYRDSGEWINVHKNGNQFYVHIFSHRTFYHALSCRLVAAINVHDKVMAEMERTNIRIALDNAALVSISDPSGIFIDINEKFSQISGYTKAYLVGKSYAQLNSGFHSPEFWSDLWNTIQSGNSWRGDIKNRARDGSFFWIDSVISPVKNSEGEIYRFIAINYDITDKKKISENRLELINDLAEYSFQTSHELRAPLARIMGLVDIFNDHPDKEFMLKNLRTSAEEMDQVIKTMNEILSRNSQLLKRNSMNKSEVK